MVLINLTPSFITEYVSVTNCLELHNSLIKENVHLKIVITIVIILFAIFLFKDEIIKLIQNGRFNKINK